MHKLTCRYAQINMSFDNLDNQSMSNQLEAMSSSAAIDDDDEFDIIESVPPETVE